jgi:hypothetical protein
MPKVMIFFIINKNYREYIFVFSIFIFEIIKISYEIVSCPDFDKTNNILILQDANKNKKL